MVSFSSESDPKRVALETASNVMSLQHYFILGSACEHRPRSYAVATVLTCVPKSLEALKCSSRTLAKTLGMSDVSAFGSQPSDENLL